MFFKNLLETFFYFAIKKSIEYIYFVENIINKSILREYVNIYIYGILIEPQNDWLNISWYNNKYNEIYTFVDSSCTVPDNVNSALIIHKMEEIYLIREVKKPTNYILENGHFLPLLDYTICYAILTKH